MFPLLQVLLLFGFPLLAGELGRKLESFSYLWDKAGIPLLFGGVYAASLALLNGVFAVVTGFYPVFVYRSGYRYYWDGDSRRVGTIQAAVGFVALVVGMVFRVLQP
jgi:hypothetical protein